MLQEVLRWTGKPTPNIKNVKYIVFFSPLSIEIGRSIRKVLIGVIAFLHVVYCVSTTAGSCDCVRSINVLESMRERETASVIICISHILQFAAAFSPNNLLSNIWGFLRSFVLNIIRWINLSSTRPNFCMHIFRNCVVSKFSDKYNNLRVLSLPDVNFHISEFLFAFSSVQIFSGCQLDICSSFLQMGLHSRYRLRADVANFRDSI